MADKNIKEKKEIIYNDKEIIDNKQTNAANFDKEEILQKIITLLLKGSSSSKYSSSKVDLRILGVRVLIVYTLTYILSLAITAIIAQKYYHEEIYTAKAFFNTIFMRVSLLYAILAIFTGIIPNTKNEIKKFYRTMKEDKKGLLFTLFLFANIIAITVLCVINAKSKIEYLAFSAIIFRKILDTFLEKYS